MSENNYIIGNLSLSAAPNGDVTQTLVTPMDINTREFEKGAIHTYVRTYSNGQWGEWNEQKSEQIPESLQIFNSLYLNSNGQMKTQPVGEDQLSAELKSLLGQLKDINELKNKLNQLENKTDFLNGRIDKAQAQNQKDNNESDTEQENNNIESFSLSSRLNTAQNKLIFIYNIQFVEGQSEYEIQCNLLQGSEYLTLDSINQETKTITYSISRNTPPSSIFEIEVQVFEDNEGTLNDKPSVVYYLDGAFRYTEPEPTYNSNWTANITINGQSENQVIQDTTFYADVNINKYSPTDVVNINSYQWSIPEGSGIEILSGARNSRCYFTIKDTSTTQQSATIQCQLKDSNNTSNSASKAVDFIYRTSDIASYFLKIQTNYGTNVEDGYILDKHFTLRYAAYHFNTQDSNYGMSVWKIIKGPVMFDPAVSGDAFQLTDDAKGGDEIIIEVYPSKDETKTDRVSLHVISGYNVPLEKFEINSGNLDNIFGDHIQLSVRTVPNIDNLKACTWELLGVSNNYVTINQSGLVSISSSAKGKGRIKFKVKATSLVDPSKSSEVQIGVTYQDTNEVNNIETIQVYQGLIYSELGEVEPGMKVAVDGKLKKYVSNGNIIPQIITDRQAGFTVQEAGIGWQYDETRITCQQALELIGNLSNGATSSTEYTIVGYVKEIGPVTSDGKQTFSIAQYDNRMSYITICYNYGGSYVDFHAQGTYMDQNLGTVNLNDADLTWEFVDDAVSDAQIQAACQNNPSVYRIVERMMVPIDQVMNSTTTIYDNNDEQYQINEVAWYDYDNFQNIPVLGANHQMTTLDLYLADPVSTEGHVIVPYGTEGTTTINFRDLAVASQQEIVPTKLRSVNTQIPHFESDVSENGMPYRVMLPSGNNYHNFILKCTYHDPNSDTDITKTSAFRFFPFESYPFPPELDRLQVITTENNLTFDDSYPTQINLRDFLVYPSNVLDDGAPGLVFENNGGQSYSLMWNGILTFNNRHNGTNKLTVYQPYRNEDPINQTKYMQKTNRFTITVNRSSNPLETDFIINCASKYIGTTDGAPLDGVTIVSKDSSNNVLLGVTYLVVGGSQYCSVSPTGSELRVFDTGGSEKEVTLKGTYGSKVSYATFKVKL